MPNLVLVQNSIATPTSRTTHEAYEIVQSSQNWVSQLEPCVRHGAYKIYNHWSMVAYFPCVREDNNSTSDSNYFVSKCFRCKDEVMFQVGGVWTGSILMDLDP